MGKKYDYCVFIGRLQPPHKSHIQNIKAALEIAKTAIIVLGSHKTARSIKNPWTASEREEMVRACFSPEDNQKLQFVYARDYKYNNNHWEINVARMVSEITGETNSVVLLGVRKDATSFYLDWFPQWKKEFIVAENKMNATESRNGYFAPVMEDLPNWRDNLQQEVVEWLQAWMSNKEYAKLANEWLFIQQYKDMWSKAPYPVTFSTTDAIVYKSGHILMVRRKFNPGKGLLALPGGFIKQDLTALDNAIEELKEETRIRLPKADILTCLKDQKVFDHPQRSLRGRTITHAFYFELPPSGELPYVKGDDDAERAMWIPVAELFEREEEIYEDHCHIINFFMNKAR